MDPFLAVRKMWRAARRHRRLVAVVLAVAVVAGVFVAYHPGVPPQSREYTVWLATADILVDTSDSQVADARLADFTTLSSRASLLANLIATDPLDTAIADSAGIPADRLVVVPPATAITSDGGAPLPPVPTLASLEVPDAEATVLKLSTDATLPILRVTAQAPDAQTAGRLAAGTVAQLERYLDSVVVRDEIPKAQTLVVRELAAPTPAPETRGTGKLAGLAVAILVALFGCASLAAAPRIGRRWKLAGEAELQPTPTGPESESAVPIDRTAHREETGADVADMAEEPLVVAPVVTVNRSDQTGEHQQQAHNQPETERAS